MNNNETNMSEITRALISRAEERFGKERAEQLRAEIELMAAQLTKLVASSVEFDDEP